MKILGIDPGTKNLGWGFIDARSVSDLKMIDHGCLQVSSRLGFYERLLELSNQLGRLLQETTPEVAVIEKIFLGRSVDSAFKLGHIRGICAAQCQAVGAEIVEYTPRTVKKQITGSGGAEKNIVQTFLYQQLNFRPKTNSLDASDALALAYCHLLQNNVNLKKQGATFR